MKLTPKIRRLVVLFKTPKVDGGIYKALNSLGSKDVGWENQKITWNNKHQDDTFTKERLDRAVENKLWLNFLRHEHRCSNRNGLISLVHYTLYPQHTRPS